MHPPSSYYLPNTFCIIIASHISNSNRLPYLTECLLSLINQSIPVTIYLSISFETAELQKMVLNDIDSNIAIQKSGKLVVCVRDKKTPQMRHIQLVYSSLAPHYEWVLFSDDDDTYESNRIEVFAENIANCLRTPLAPHLTIAGAYESTFGKDHRSHRHEFWCYCVRRYVLERFFNKMEIYPDILENKCCDVLFAEYIRRLSPSNLFIRITTPVYNYRVENNSDSITGFIQSNQHKYTVHSEPPPTGDAKWIDYVMEWNEYLHENLSVYMHDTYLRTIVGVPFNDILIAEFRANAPLLEFVDVCHVNKMREFHERISKVCNELYDAPLERAKA